MKRKVDKRPVHIIIILIKNTLIIMTFVDPGIASRAKQKMYHYKALTSLAADVLFPAVSSTSRTLERS